MFFAFPHLPREHMYNFPNPPKISTDFTANHPEGLKDADTLGKAAFRRLGRHKVLPNARFREPALSVPVLARFQGGGGGGKTTLAGQGR